MFHCPACGHCHYWDSRWTNSGTEERPTLHPSIRVAGGCHFHLVDGRFHFEGDTVPEEWRGRVVEMEDF